MIEGVSRSWVSTVDIGLGIAQRSTAVIAVCSQPLYCPVEFGRLHQISAPLMVEPDTWRTALLATNIICINEVSGGISAVHWYGKGRKV